jgi:hypothetical protein
MRYLTYCALRRRPWTEHNCFPNGAYDYWAGTHKSSPLTFYSVSDDGLEIRFIIRYQYDKDQRKVFVQDTFGNLREVQL